MAIASFDGIISNKITAEIRVVLIPKSGGEKIIITQSLEQLMPLYQAFLNNGLLEVCNRKFIDFMEDNKLGHIVGYRRYDFDEATGQPHRMAAVF